MSSLPDVPRIRLIDGPSPLGALRRLGGALGGRADLWIKREDLLPLAFGGNKLRNLEFLLGEALARGADCLVTSGRRWSNHCRLTAAAGARAGLDVHVVLSGAERPDSPGPRLDRLLGATVHWAGRADRAERAALVERVAADLRSAGRRPYVIGVGGSGLTGALGQVAAAFELADQAAAAGIEPSVLVLPSATGGTQAGLLVGLRARSLGTRVVGLAVASPADELRPIVEGLVAGLCPLLDVTVDGDEVVVDGSQRGPGYGVVTAAATEASELIARTEGILVDPIYTAKALAGLIALVRRGELDGATVVFWHAGGLPALFEPLEGSR